MEYLHAAWAILCALLATAFVQTLLGGLISAWAASRAVDRQLLAAKESREDGDKAQLESLESAIKLELETIRELHLGGVGEELQKCRDSGGRFDSYYPIFSDYFTLFAGNAGAIGRAQPNVARSVVQAYVHLKALVDTFRFNNALLDRAEDLALRGVPDLDKRMVDIVGQLDEYGPKLIASHDRAMKSVEGALDTLSSAESLRRQS
ncbi:hypothetical protein [Stenotrophomonas riyadhensis]